MQPPSVPPHIQQLRPYVPGKPIEEVQREFGLNDIIKLASNENPLGPSPRALDALAAAVRQLAFYPEGACPELVRALAGHWGVSEQQLVVGNGSDEIIHYLGLVYLRPGDQVLTADPSFVRYEAAAVLNQAEFVALPLRDYTFHLEALSEALTEKTRLVFIANPNNPTGTIVDKRELAAFLAGVPAETIVVLDEAYYEYVDDPEYPRSLDYLEAGQNVVVLRTFSKIYALAGLRVGYGIARPEIIQAIHQVREPFNVNSLAQAAARASLEDSEQVPRSRAANTAGKHYLYGEFERLRLRYVPTQANFVVVDVRRPSEEVFAGMLRRGVIVRAGKHLGLPTCLRVTIGTAGQNRRFISELEAVLAELPALAGAGG